MASSLRANSGAAVNFFSFIDIITGVTGVLILVTLLLATRLNPTLRSAGGLPEDAPDPQVRAKLDQVLLELSAQNLSNQVQQETLAAAKGAPSQASLQADISAQEVRIRELQTRLTQTQTEMAKAVELQRERDEQLGLSAANNNIEQLRKEVASLTTAVAAAAAEMAALETQAREAEARLLQAQRDQHKLWVIPETSTTSKEPLLLIVDGRSVSLEQFNKATSRVVLNNPSRREFKELLGRYKSLDYYLVFYVRPSGITSFRSLLETAKDQGYEVGYDPLEEQTQIAFSKPTP